MDSDSQSLARLCDPEAYSASAAIAIAKERARLDSLFGSRLTRAILDVGRPGDTIKVLRLLEILEAISETVRVVLISPLLHHPDARVQSKTALLVAKANQNLRWVQQRLRDPDARVRANALEALWGMDSQEAKAVFRQAAEDLDNRVAGNALLGLYRAGEPKCIEKFAAMAKNPSDLFRSTAIWAMQQTGDPAFIPILSELLRECAPALRTKVMRALTSLKVAQARQAPAGQAVASAATPANPAEKSTTSL